MTCDGKTHSFTVGIRYSHLTLSIEGRCGDCNAVLWRITDEAIYRYGIAPFADELGIDKRILETARGL